MKRKTLLSQLFKEWCKIQKIEPNVKGKLGKVCLQLYLQRIRNFPEIFHYSTENRKDFLWKPQSPLIMYSVVHKILFPIISFIYSRYQFPSLSKMAEMLVPVFEHFK